MKYPTARISITTPAGAARAHLQSGEQHPAPAPTAADTPVDAPARHDLYAFIHKALRRYLADMLGRLGLLDVHDGAEMQATLGQLQVLLTLMKKHLEHENRFVHPAIEARRPGTSARIGQEHEEHVDSIDALAAEAEALRAAPAVRQPLLALRLYRHFALFVAENFQHMHYEETVHNAALWECYADDELHTIHDELVAGIPADEMVQILRWMAPALTPQERAGMFGPMQMQMPPEGFRAVLEIVQPVLSQAAWAKLARELNVPAAPGLTTA